MPKKYDEKQIKIAIDGPAGAGKSSVAKEVAEALHIDYLDTGAMYRAVAYFVIEKKVDISDEQMLKTALCDIKIDYAGGVISLNGVELKDEIRTVEVTNMATKVSALVPVREKLVSLQRDIAEKKSIVLDGRDIGTNVLPDAQLKIFLTASAKMRATRRHKELIERGVDVPFSQVLEDIKKRDANDEGRKIDPLRCAEDAIVVDSSDMSKEEVVDFLVKKAEALMKN